MQTEPEGPAGYQQVSPHMYYWNPGRKGEKRRIFEEQWLKTFQN